MGYDISLVASLVVIYYHSVYSLGECLKIFDAEVMIGGNGFTQRGGTTKWGHKVGVKGR